MNGFPRVKVVNVWRIQLNYQEIRHAVSLDLGMHLGPDALHLIPSLKDVLRLSCKLCVEDGKVDINKVAQYLKVHEVEASLLRYLTRDQKLPWLVREGDDMRLEQSP